MADAARGGTVLGSPTFSTVIANSIRSNAFVGLVAGGAGYVHNALSGNNGGNTNPQVSGGLQLGPNVCGLDTSCP